MVTFKIIQIEKGKGYTSACIGIIYLSVFAEASVERGGGKSHSLEVSPVAEGQTHCHWYGGVTWASHWPLWAAVSSTVGVYRCCVQFL